MNKYISQQVQYVVDLIWFNSLPRKHNFNLAIFDYSAKDNTNMYQYKVSTELVNMWWIGDVYLCVSINKLWSDWNHLNLYATGVDVFVLSRHRPRERGHNDESCMQDLY